MIVKSFELNSFKIKDKKIHLIFGNNEGLKNDILDKIYLKDFSGEILKYDEQEILVNKDSLISNLFNKSLFEDKKIIVISRATEKIFNLINEIMEKELSEVNITFDACFIAIFNISDLFDLSLLPPHPNTTTKFSKYFSKEDKKKLNAPGLCA